jgi:hypothetical protein
MKNELAILGKKFYDEHLKHILEPEHNGEFVSIEPESGQYFIGKTDVEAMKKSREALPKKKKYLVRIGFEVAYKIGGFNAATRR